MKCAASKAYDTGILIPKILPNIVDPKPSRASLFRDWSARSYYKQFQCRWMSYKRKYTQGKLELHIALVPTAKYALRQLRLHDSRAVTNWCSEGQAYITGEFSPASGRSPLNPPNHIYFVKNRAAHGKVDFEPMQLPSGGVIENSSSVFRLTIQSITQSVWMLQRTQIMVDYKARGLQLESQSQPSIKKYRQERFRQKMELGRNAIWAWALNKFW